MRLRIKDITTKVGSGITPRGGAESYLEQGIPLFRSQNVHNNGFLYDDIAYISDEVDEIMSNTRVKAGDVLLNITGASIGRCFYTPEDFECGNVNQHVCIIRPKKHIVKSAYLHFCIISDEGQEQIKFMQTGANRDGLAVEDIKSFSFDIPSLQVQQCIVEYLEAKTTEIDKKIELLGKKRDAYKRLKTATINRAVTRGLDEHVKLKDTDIDWIGEIPVHWETRRIKDEVEVNKLTLTESTSPMYKFRYIDISNVSSEGVISFIEEVYFYEAPSRARRIVQKGDIIVSTVRTYLKSIGMIDFDAKDVVVSTGFAVLSPIKSYSKYFYYLLRSNHLIDEICALSSGVSYPAIAATRIESINIPVPPLEEQKQIAAYLDERCAKIDAAVTIIGKQIDALKRLKRSLINEVVTGKRMV